MDIFENSESKILKKYALSQKKFLTENDQEVITNIYIFIS